MYEERRRSLDDPRGFLVELLYKEGMHLKQNKAFVNSESDTIVFFRNNKSDRSFIIYRNFLEKMIAFWEKNGYRTECDIEKIISVGRAAGILITNSELIDEEHFAAIYRVFCEAEIDRFFKCQKTDS